jgi:hypothetical protein
MRHSESHPDAAIDTLVPPRPREDGWTITPRAVTTIATIITILYSLHAPVRYVMEIASSVEALNTRVAALEALAAQAADHTSADRRDPANEPHPTLRAH